MVCAGLGPIVVVNLQARVEGSSELGAIDRVSTICLFLLLDRLYIVILWLAKPKEFGGTPCGVASLQLCQSCSL